MNANTNPCDYKDFQSNHEKVRQHWQEYCKHMVDGLPTNYGDQAIDNLIAHIMHEHPFYEWRYAESIAKDLGMNMWAVAASLQRMLEAGQVVKNPRNPDYWGVVSRVGPQKGAVVQPILNPKTFEVLPQREEDMFHVLKDCISQAKAAVKVATVLADEVTSWKIA